MSELTDTPSVACAAAAAIAEAEPSEPTSADSTAFARYGCSPTPVSATRAWLIEPPLRAMTTATPTMAYPEAGTASFSYAPPTPSGSRGRRTATRISSASAVVVNGPGEEAVERDDPLAAGRAEDRRIVEREEDRRRVGGRVGMRHRAADGAQIADLDVADVRDGVAGPLELRLRHDLGVGRHRPDLRSAVLRVARADEAGDAPDVHEGGRPCEAQLHERQQALAAGDDLRAGLAGGLRRLLDRAGSDVVECGRDHAWPPFAAWIADQTVCGVYGMSRWLMPSGAQRVVDGVGHGGGAGDRARLADALDAERVDRRRGDRLVELDVREPRRPWERVVHHRTR